MKKIFLKEKKGRGKVSFKGGLQVLKKLLESFLFKKKAAEKKNTQAISTEENNLLIEVIFWCYLINSKQVPFPKS